MDFIFLESALFLSVQVLYQSNQNCYKNSVKFALNMCSCFYSVFWLGIQIEHKLACCHCFKFCHLEVKRKKVIFSYNFSSPLSLSCHACHVCCVVCSGVTMLNF